MQKFKTFFYQYENKSIVLKAVMKKVCLFFLGGWFFVEVVYDSHVLFISEINIAVNKKRLSIIGNFHYNKHRR
jgi:hypothetical protein